MTHPTVQRSELEERVAAVERLTALFRAERMVHLAVTTISLVMLLASAGFLIVRQQAGTFELSMLFGSSGLITYSATRLLHMWNQALSVLTGSSLEVRK